MEEVKIVCKCIPGFEQVAILECLEKLQVAAKTNHRGRVLFNMKISDACTVQKLRSVSHYWVVVFENTEYFLHNERTSEEQFQEFNALAATLDWKKPLQTWKLFKMDYNSRYETKTNDILPASIKNTMEPENSLSLPNGSAEPSSAAAGREEGGAEDGGGEDREVKETHSFIDYTDIDPLRDGDKLSFRVTANRTGKHNFTSMEAAQHFGGGVNDYFNWRVDMKKFDIEVVLHAEDDLLDVGIKLTRDNQSHRNIKHFGPTTLKANISYSLLRYAQVMPGDVVCDPMCGSGSISAEGALGCPDMFQLAGENHPLAIQHASENVEALELKRSGNFTLPASVVQWDIYHLPLRTSSVDKLVTDLPFGKKIGNKDRNMFLYPVALREMGRVCRTHGKAVLLTGHKGAIARAVKNCELWKQVEVKKICMGGLNVVVYSLQRTEFPYTPFVKQKDDDKGKPDEKRSRGER